MLFGLDGVEIGLIIVFMCLFGGILSGFPVAFAIGGAGIISFAIIAALDSAGLLIHQAIDTSSAMYADLIREGVRPDAISKFRFPDLPRYAEPVFPQGWETAMDRNISFVVNRMNERVLAGQSIETLLAVVMFVLMGITLERSKIANDLLTTMSRVFGPLPGGLAVSVVVVGAFLAASTGIVGATVVTMGLLSLPTMLKAGYSPQLATGVIAASGTLGQIIPPSIVIVLLGTLAGDLYSAAQEERANLAGCSDALTFLGEPAVVSVGTLFQAALLPGIMLAVLYGLYAFGFAMFNPSKAPAVELDDSTGEVVTRNEALTWFLGVPVLLIVAMIGLGQLNVIGTQNVIVDSFSDAGQTASLRTNVSEDCKVAMIDLHGQEAWDTAVAEQQTIDEAGGVTEARALNEDERAAALQDKLATAAPIGTGIAISFLMLALVLTTARGVSPTANPLPLLIGGAGVVLALLADALLINPLSSSGFTFLVILIPLLMALYGVRYASGILSQNELLRVVFPPLVLIVAVLGSILGGITNPTPAAALGAGGAIMLAAYRKLADDNKSGKMILNTTFAVVIMILVGVNFDLRVGLADVAIESWIAFLVAQAAYLFSIFGLFYALWVLFSGGVLTPVVRETAKVTSMVFTILIGSQLLNLVVISFGGEHYIQTFLQSFDNEFKVFLIVMLVLFVLGFVLDFLEIIYIVIPIVGPVIYGGTFDPKWVTIMIAVNLQTSFLTPPFGFALFYLRGVAPKEVTTGHIYRGVIPFVLIQVAGLALLWFFPSIVTIVPDLIPN
ncbi:TRAP transporter large permease subunit [Marinovum sp. 2_MG-2023]|uniref:TRAP transporter large permease n=1 Tax=Roseobacteraceae TaxID=2854170 RepID=UPI001FD4E14C|nr:MULTISPECIES: TRAP transporter large permease subunit [Roseobacteraceae]MCJ7873611.1 TRAP transporter large permease subunit [Phaeobacter sp. J2-8]MDO6730393.1 TRAP transporter large permease subunit [Marinovum sp. 2_MG-2023]MDO6778373.1 TRAP transporter large permease subunit [Marinovum sp. 1_MG-2023]